MKKAILNQMHIPERCTCEHHLNKAFICQQVEHKFQSIAEMVNTLIKWNKQQGKDACWVYEILDVQDTR